MKGRGFLVACVGCVLVFGALASPARGGPRLHQAFEQASEAFDVPVTMLGAVSKVTSSWHHAGQGDGVEVREFGIMGLRAGGASPGLEEAAAALGVSVERVRDEERCNILGGAAVLAAYFREAGGELGVPSEITLENAWAWWEAVGRYSGLDDPVLRDMFAVHVFEAMDSGLEGRTDSGEYLVFDASVMPSVLGEWIQDARRRYQALLRASATSTDYAGAVWVPACSSNYTDSNRGPGDIFYVVIHISEGSYAGTISWFQNCSSQVSAHYVVSKYGEVTQMVREADIAWHAGNWDYNVMSIGIEHEGHTYENDITDAEYRASAALTADICARNGIPTTRDYIIGHEDVPGSVHTDPGPYWDWDYYLSLVNGGTSTQTASLVGYVRENDIYTGTGIPGAEVRLDSGRSTSTDGNGFYRFDNLEVGTYTVTASAPCYSSGSKTRTLEPGIDNWASIALTPDGSCGAQTVTLKGYVREADIYTGPAIPDATVRLDDGRTTTTGPDGLYEFLDVEVGTYTITVDAPCYAPAGVTKTLVPGEDNWASVALTPDGSCDAFGSILGDVRDADTLEPVRYATITLDTGDTTQTDRNGRFEFLQVPVGDRVLDVSADCYLDASQTVAVVEGQGTSVVVDLEPDTACAPSCDGTPEIGRISGLPASTTPRRRGAGATAALVFLGMAGAILRRHRRS